MSFIGATKGRYGNILYWNYDIVMGSSIAAYGEWFESEVDVFRQYVKPGDAVIDCGANVGTHTLALASIVGPTGAVMALEPQRPLFQVMCANAILNGYLNVHPIMSAAGELPCYKKFIEPDYAKPNSFGGYETTARAEVKEGTGTRVDRLDSLWLSTFGDRPLTFAKIDVEGSEADAIRSGAIVIQRDRPVLYVENDRRENSAELISLLRAYDYGVFWHIAPFYNPNNLTGRANDIPMHRYGWVGGKINGASLMLLCLPPEKNLATPPDCMPVGVNDEYPPFGEA